MLRPKVRCRGDCLLRWVVVLAFTGIWERVSGTSVLGARTTVLACKVKVFGQTTRFTAVFCERLWCV